jgi:surface protein
MNKKIKSLAIATFFTFNTIATTFQTFALDIVPNDTLVESPITIGNSIRDFLTDSEINELLNSGQNSVTLNKFNNIDINSKNTTLIIPSQFIEQNRTFNVEVNLKSLFSELDLNQRYNISALQIGTDKTIKVVGELEGVFAYFENIKTLDLSLLDTSNVTDMSSMFDSCYSLENVNLSKLDTSKVVDMSSMFSACTNLTSIDLSNFNTSNVYNMASMFLACSSLKNIDVSHFDTSQVTNMSGMFGICHELETIDVSNFNTSNVVDFSYMFANCSTLKNLDLSKFDVANAETMAYMFDDCNALTNLDFKYFTDICQSSEKDKIQEFKDLGYVSGYKYNEFKPEENITRAEFVKLVNRVFNFTEEGCENFSDINGSDWFYKDVLIAMNAGYIKGYEDNTFRGNNPITREEIAVIITRIKNLKPMGQLSFTDAYSISNWATDSVNAIFNNNIVQGYSDNTFRPKENAKREHVVKMLYNASKN